MPLRVGARNVIADITMDSRPGAFPTSTPVRRLRQPSAGGVKTRFDSHDYTGAGFPWGNWRARALGNQFLRRERERIEERLDLIEALVKGIEPKLPEGNGITGFLNLFAHKAPRLAAPIRSA